MHNSLILLFYDENTKKKTAYGETVFLSIKCLRELPDAKLR